MRQAVRVGCQIRLPRIRSPGKTGMQSVAAVSSTNDCGVGGFASNCPIASSQTWTGGPVKLLCPENLALSTALFSVMSASKVQLYSVPEGRHTNCCRPHQTWDRGDGF